MAQAASQLQAYAEMLRQLDGMPNDQLMVAAKQGGPAGVAAQDVLRKRSGGIGALLPADAKSFKPESLPPAGPLARAQGVPTMPLEAAADMPPALGQAPLAAIPGGNTDTAGRAAAANQERYITGDAGERAMPGVFDMPSATALPPPPANDLAFKAPGALTALAATDTAANPVAPSAEGGTPLPRRKPTAPDRGTGGTPTVASRREPAQQPGLQRAPYESEYSRAAGVGLIPDAEEGGIPKNTLELAGLAPKGSPEQPGQKSTTAADVMASPAVAEKKSSGMGMALMQAGLAILASRNPSGIGAIGEGGLAGLQGYQQSQYRAEQNRRADKQDARLERNDARQDSRSELEAQLARERMDLQREELGIQRERYSPDNPMNRAEIERDAAAAAASRAAAGKADRWTPGTGRSGSGKAKDKSMTDAQEVQRVQQLMSAATRSADERIKSMGLLERKKVDRKALIEEELMSQGGMTLGEATGIIRSNLGMSAPLATTPAARPADNGDILNILK